MTRATPPAEFPQLVLDLARPADLSREALVETKSNAMAVAWIDRWPDWPGPAVVLHGPPSSGKSHLLGSWAQATNALVLDVGQLEHDVRPRSITTVALDDAQHIAGNSAAEEALFHLYNELHRTGGSMLLTARLPVSRWPIRLPDLATRLRAAPQVAIEAPDDDALISVLQKHLEDMQLEVATRDLQYAISYIERSFEEAARFAVFINRVSFRDQRKVNRHYLARVIKEFVAA